MEHLLHILYQAILDNFTDFSSAPLEETLFLQEGEDCTTPTWSHLPIPTFMFSLMFLEHLLCHLLNLSNPLCFVRLSTPSPELPV